MSLLRLDRFAAVHCVRPVRRVFSRPNRMRIPIVMYHSISNDSCKSVHADFPLETSTPVFEAQIRYLYENGYATLSTADAVGLLNCGQSASKKYVVLTFDDGFHDFYTNAFPILNKYGFNATVYLPTAYINSRSRPLLGKDCLTWTEVKELGKSGVSFGSHTISHSKLENMSDAVLEREIRGSKEIIEENLGTPVRSFAYPYAFPEQDRGFAHRLRDLLRAAGYHDGVSKVVGTVQSLEERFFLRRMPVNTRDGIALFEAKLEGDYDWFHTVQRALSSMERMRSIRIWRRAKTGTVAALSESLPDQTLGYSEQDLPCKTTTRTESR